ncbi:hypothetical protein ARMSODRAFT_978699 [Armillaria solidipes]|uniref:Uncharacterized protein n=1 Tax=Armillaria solidipes TaxID=1076256 RepID=A0A2H3BD95_9AGAR|nr:hypothetical protein ARMSODRAFT_978699 [Armillaria solidipes]
MIYEGLEKAKDKKQQWEIISRKNKGSIIVLVIYLVTYARRAYDAVYVDAIAQSIRGMAPTLIVGHVASGHSSPDDTSRYLEGNRTQTQGSSQDNGQRTAPSPEDGNPDADDALEEPKPAMDGVWFREKARPKLLYDGSKRYEITLGHK